MNKEISENELFEMGDRIITMYYNDFCDDNSIYVNGDNDSKENIVTKHRKRHKIIIESLSKGKKVDINTKIISNEDEYVDLLQKQSDIFSAYIEVLKKREKYSKLLDQEEETNHEP